MLNHFAMTTRNEKHNWVKDGPNILSPEKLKAIERLCPIIVEHRVYCGGGNPYKLVFDDVEDFTEYLRVKAKPGDNIIVWSYYDLCRDDNISGHGKYPDVDGCVPTGGAY